MSLRLRIEEEQGIMERSSVVILGTPLFAAVLGCALLLASCGRYDEAIWTEEVLLHDGRMIQVWRRATRQPSGFPIAPRGRELEVELKYPELGVHWKYDGGLRWPMSFELFNGVPHLVLGVREREWCKGKPPDALPAQFLTWKDNK